MRAQLPREGPQSERRGSSDPRPSKVATISDDDKRQALSFFKTLVGNLDVARWPSEDDGSVTYVESFRTVKLWREGDEVLAEVASNAGTAVTLTGNDYRLVRELAEAVGVPDAGDGA